MLTTASPVNKVVCNSVIAKSVLDFLMKRSGISRLGMSKDLEKTELETGFFEMNLDIGISLRIFLFFQVHFSSYLNNSTKVLTKVCLQLHLYRHNYFIKKALTARRNSVLDFLETKWKTSLEFQTRTFKVYKSDAFSSSLRSYTLVF